VDLRGRLSNPSAREQVDLVADLMTQLHRRQTGSHVALREARRPCVRDTVDVGELVRQFVAGSLIKDLAAGYAISESSVKRILRASGARRASAPSMSAS
jgi:hypothetical protein